MITTFFFKLEFSTNFLQILLHPSSLEVTCRQQCGIAPIVKTANITYFDQPANLYSHSQESAIFGTNYGNENIHHDAFNDDDMKYLMQTLAADELIICSEVSSNNSNYSDRTSLLQSEVIYSTSRQRELITNFQGNTRIIMKRIEDILNDETRMDKETAKEMKALLGFYGLHSFNYLSDSQPTTVLENEIKEQENVNLKVEENLKVDEEATYSDSFSKSFETEIEHLMWDNLSYSLNQA